jgi:hypothetical protein
MYVVNESADYASGVNFCMILCVLLVRFFDSRLVLAPSKKWLIVNSIIREFRFL